MLLFSRSLFVSRPSNGNRSFLSSRNDPLLLSPGAYPQFYSYTKVIALTCQYKKFSPDPHGPLSPFICSGAAKTSLHMQLVLVYVMDHADEWELCI